MQLKHIFISYLYLIFFLLVFVLFLHWNKNNISEFDKTKLHLFT